MEITYYLLKYVYHTYCQGTRDRSYGYALVKIPESNDETGFITAREVLMSLKNKDNYYEIDFDSIEDQTISFFDCDT